MSFRTNDHTLTPERRLSKASEKLSGETIGLDLPIRVIEVDADVRAWPLAGNPHPP